MKSQKLEEATVRALQGNLKTANKMIERKVGLNEDKIVWSTDLDMDNVDVDYYRDEVYQNYLDNFDPSVTPMSYEEWLDSDNCGSLFDDEWEDVYQQTGEYADWSDFILNYISDEEKEYYYNEYVENCKTITRQPDDFETWLNNNNEMLDNDYWEIAKEDLEYNVLPNIDRQVNNDVLLLLGSYGSNYPEFKKSGQGGKLFRGTDDFQDYMGNFDGVNITLDNGILGATLYDHDGTVSGDFYTLPKDYMKVIKALGYEDIVKEEYDEEDLDKYNIEDLMEDTFNEDLRYGNIEAQDFEEVRELLVPIKDAIDVIEEDKKLSSHKPSKREFDDNIIDVYKRDYKDMEITYPIDSEEAIKEWIEHEYYDMGGTKDYEDFKPYITKLDVFTEDDLISDNDVRDFANEIVANYVGNVVRAYYKLDIEPLNIDEKAFEELVEEIKKEREGNN